MRASLMEAESNSRRWKTVAKEAVERAILAEAERDVARRDVAMARLDIEAVGSARAQAEFKLAHVQIALVSLEDT